MDSGPLARYTRALSDFGPLGLRTEDGRLIPLDVARWLGGADATDATVIERCVGPVLDVGCGPGRFVSELLQRGIAALGVDIAETAVALTREQGLPALLRSVFAHLPGEGRWPTVLLLDGNVGIGGDPARLLTRIASLLGPGGRLIVEAHRDPEADELLQVRLSTRAEMLGPVFDWAFLGMKPLVRHAARAGYATEEFWAAGGRPFAVFTRG